jgi:hypothetical protein
MDNRVPPNPGKASRVISWVFATPRRPVVLGLLTLAFLLRLAFLPDARFTGDEALFYEQATRAAWGEWFPWIGPVVTNGPLRHPGGTFYLLMALPLTLTRSPLGPMALVALLNVLAYGLLYRVFARRLGAGAGLLFLGLLLFSPWSFFYSDRIWNSNLVLPLSALFLWAGYHVLDTPRSPRLFWAVFALVVFPQFHLSVLLPAAVGLLLLIIYRPALRWRSGLYGLIAGLIFYAPYLVAEVRSGFANTRLLFSGTSGGGEGPREALRALVGFVSLPSTEASYFVARGFWFPHDVFAYYKGGPGLSELFTFLGGGAVGALLIAGTLLSLAVVAAGLIAVLIRVCTKPRMLLDEPLTVAFLLALLTIPAVFLLSGKPYFPHYVYPLYPLAFVAPLAALRPLLARPSTARVSVALVALVALSGIAISARYYREVDGLVGVRSSTEIVETLLDVARGAPIDISFDVERSRLSPGPLQRLARYRYLQNLTHASGAPVRARIFSPARWQQFQSLPEYQRRLRGAPLAGSRTLSRVTVAWTR